MVYLVAGLKYDTGVWRELWPRIMANAIEACKRANARLVFFDNVYMYGRVEGAMTEETPFNPCSKKGEIRARIATMLLGLYREDGGLDYVGSCAVAAGKRQEVADRVREIEAIL